MSETTATQQPTIHPIPEGLAERAALLGGTQVALFLTHAGRVHAVQNLAHDLGEALTLSSRIILLSARPGRLKDDFEIPFPRPRDAVSLRETAEFGRLYSHIWHALGEEFRRTKAE